MPTENITRAEAIARSAQITATSYEVELDLTTGNDWFRSTTRAVFSATTDASWIDLIAREIESATLNGAPIDVASAFDGTRLQLTGLSTTNELIIVAKCNYMNTGEGLHRFVDPVDDEVYLYSQFETADARRMYACFEQPDLKATFTLTVTAPSHWEVISNEMCTSRDGDTWHFATTPVMSTYITALVAGPYHVVRDEFVGANGSIPLGLYCRRSLAQFLDADEIFLITKQGFEFFEATFAYPYPFSKYDQLFVPEFNNGAMENAGCVTFLEEFVFRSRVTDAAYEERSNTILHEMAHMWFGDLVTMKWWDDLWLNESFAEWAASHANTRATRFTDAWTTFANLRKAWAYRQDQLPSTHPIAADMVDLDAVRVNFDGITYAKGASALRQLVAYVGEAEFIAGLRSYFAKYAWGNTELTDLLTELEATSGRDLTAWTKQWLQTSGVNLLRPVIDVTDGVYERVLIRQEPPVFPADVMPRVHRIRLGLFDLVDGELVRRDQLELDLDGEETLIHALAGVRQPDLLLLNDDDLTFAKIRLDERSWATATEQLGTISDSLARAVIWSAAWDMTRDGEVATGDFLKLVISGLPSESEISVAQGILRQLRTAIDMYAAPEHRDGYLVTLATALRGFMESAAPGSDHQLAFVRSFIWSAVTDEDLDTVAALLDGTTVLDGLAVDTDLRWSLLHRLVVMGRRGTDAVIAERERDDTAAGHRSAESALAARPSADAKLDAWSSVFTNTELPNAVLEATMGGFASADQLALLEPFRSRYFDDVLVMWSQRTPEMAQNIATMMYPVLLVDAETVRLTDAFLARDDLNPSLRRLVSENLDGVRRAMRARATDARS